jgi:hypothetical protein
VVAVDGQMMATCGQFSMATNKLAESRADRMPLRRRNGRGPVASGLCRQQPAFDCLSRPSALGRRPEQMQVTLRMKFGD